MVWAMLHYKERFETNLNDETTLPAILKGFKFEVLDPGTKASGDGVQLRVLKNDHIYFSGFFQQYAACCAFEQLNHFYYTGSDEEAVIFAMLNHYILTMRKSYRHQFAKKLVINTVQNYPVNEDGYAKFRSDHGFIKAEECGDGEHIYPLIYKWASQFEHVDTPVINHNTSRIIHHIITSPKV
jgi:hypothetical protein